MTMLRFLRRPVVATAVVVAIAVAVILTVILRNHHDNRQLPPTRAREYTTFQACLLTGEKGLADPAAQPVWAGLQDGSLKTHAKVSYLAATGPDTPGNLLSYTATLAQRQCNLIIAVGEAETAAILQDAPQHDHVKYVTIGGQTHGNITALSPGTPTEIRSAVATALEQSANP